MELPFWVIRLKSLVYFYWKLGPLQYLLLKVCTTTQAQLHDLVNQFVTDSSGHVATWCPLSRIIVRMKEDNNVYNILGTIPDTCSILKSVISSLSFPFVTELRAVGERSTQLTPWKWMECVSLLENVGFSFGKEAPGWMSRVAIKNRHWAPKPGNKEHQQSPNATSSVRVEALAKGSLKREKINDCPHNSK